MDRERKNRDLGSLINGQGKKEQRSWVLDSLVQVV